MDQHQPHRVALYARYSNDRLQKETSLVDQLRLARTRAEREGWPIVIERSDGGVSASMPIALRAGSKALLADALARRFEILIVECLDRLARDIGDQEQVVKRLEFRGIRIIGISDGYDTHLKGRKVMRVARGLVNELYLDDLGEKTHRGLAGQFDRGFHVGGVCYGYRTQATADERGRELVIDEDQARVVRRIFAEYAEGTSARAIAHRLNADGIASPRGGTWAVSALVGDRKRGAGLLNSEIYNGKLVWNRRQWLKDPETGKRRYVDRPKEEWQTRDMPQLRIVDEDVWAAVRARDRQLARQKPGGPVKTLFAGVLRCAVCGGPMTAIDARRYGCHAMRDRGKTVCEGSGAFPRAKVEQALLSVVREDLLAPDVLVTVAKTVQTAVRDAAAAMAARVPDIPARRAALQAEIERLVDAIAQVGLSEALKGRLATAERELATLPADAAPRALDVDRITQKALAAYKQRLFDLGAALQHENADRERTRSLLAEILGPVKLLRDDEGEWAEMEEPAQRLASFAGSTLPALVARARNVRRKLIRAAGR